MKSTTLCSAFLSALLFSLPTWAIEINVDQPWAWSTPPGRTTANVYFHITSSAAAKITGASSPAAEKVILETMDHSGPRMKILTINEVPLPAGQKLDMTSEHSYHLKLVNLNQPLKAGQNFPLNIQISPEKGSSETIEIKVQVKKSSEK